MTILFASVFVNGQLLKSISAIFRVLVWTAEVFLMRLRRWSPAIISLSATETIRYAGFLSTMA